MKYMLAAFAAFVLACGCKSGNPMPAEVTMSKDILMDKIKGAWAGQTIGCTFGGPTEFKYSGTMINDNINILWPEHRIKWYFDHAPGLYDDVYMDLTFVDVFDKRGLNAPIEDFAYAFANAGYPLWHANQQARYNILHGIMPPASGYWENNPHADDIDFQIEADYAGIMAPGMVNAAVHYSDDIGHIMNYGDGWYGGVYVAAMYALAFVSNDINYIVEEALKVIPPQSKYYRCMSDVIKWHKMYPDDWTLTWVQCQKNWSFDIGCPGGVYNHFNIDATINSAYILIGLLYGEGDFARTLEISTRCGQDSDCNPASAGGILGTMLGYSNIPEYWMANLREVEDRDFAYTDISLNKVYNMSFNQALQVIGLNGGSVSENEVTIKTQVPETVRFEESFTGHWPIAYKDVKKPIENVKKLTFEGNGVVVNFDMPLKSDSYEAKVEVWLDGSLSETVLLPANEKTRKQQMYYKYNLPPGKHTLSFKCLNPEKNMGIKIRTYLVYSDKAEIIRHQ